MSTITTTEKTLQIASGKAQLVASNSSKFFDLCPKENNPGPNVNQTR